MKSSCLSLHGHVLRLFVPEGNSSGSCLRGVLVLAMLLSFLDYRSESVAQEISAQSQATQVTEDQLLHVGGKWYVSKEEPKKYYYLDAKRWVDLFSYHTLDSNKDGVANVRISHDENHLIVQSQGYPNHPTAVFPNSDNPNSIRVQDFTFRFPLVPRKAEVVTRLPMGPIGMSLNGVVFFNPFEMGGKNAVEGYDEVWLDSCCGHPQQTGVYHYHKYPTCVKSPFVDNGQGHSPIIGFAFDGYPVYGPFESNGIRAVDLTNGSALDACNGHEDSERGYHYHVTPDRFPYILGGYAGVVETSNNRQLRRAQTGSLEDPTQPGEKYGKPIGQIQPETLERGRTHLLRIPLDRTGLRRPIPDGSPNWVQFGPYEATSMRREGDVIFAEISIPEDADLGSLLDCHIEFPPEQRPVVFKKNGALRIVAP
jgi:hypothetical protein